METNEYREQRLASMQTLKEMGYEPYGCKYDHVDLKVARETFEEGKPVRVAGRLLMIRRMGKMNFCTITTAPTASSSSSSATSFPRRRLPPSSSSISAT